MSKQTEALKFARKVLNDCHHYINDAFAAYAALEAALAEQPAQRCPLCDYQHGHAIGCENNPVDIALNKMAENARELGLDYEPAQQQEPVAWRWKMSLIPDAWQLSDRPHPDAALKEPLYTFPLASKPWVGLTDEDVTSSHPYSITRDKGCFHAGAEWADAKLREKNT